MKKLNLILIALTFPLLMSAQKNAADKVFEKYAGKDGFTTVYVSKGLFKFLSKIEDDDDDLKALSGIESIKILTTDDPRITDGINFYDEVIKDLKMAPYEELMTVKESHQDIKILVNEKNGIIRELLLIAGGDGCDNVLIIIRGNIDLKKMPELSNSIHMDELEILEALEAGEEL